MAYKIIEAVWWGPPLPLAIQAPALGIRGVIGAVAIKSNDADGAWKVYIGYGLGQDEEADCQAIARRGHPLGNKAAACAFFPQMDPEKYRY